jgi:hypothetical protein
VASAGEVLIGGLGRESEGGFLKLSARIMIRRVCCHNEAAHALWMQLKYAHSATSPVLANDANSNEREKVARQKPPHHLLCGY